MKIKHNVNTGSYELLNFENDFWKYIWGNKTIPIDVLDTKLLIMSLHVTAGSLAILTMDIWQPEVAWIVQLVVQSSVYQSSS